MAKILGLDLQGGAQQKAAVVAAVAGVALVVIALMSRRGGGGASDEDLAAAYALGSQDVSGSGRMGAADVDASLVDSRFETLQRQLYGITEQLAQFGEVRERDHRRRDDDDADDEKKKPKKPKSDKDKKGKNGKIETSDGRVEKFPIIVPQEPKVVAFKEERAPLRQSKVTAAFGEERASLRQFVDQGGEKITAAFGTKPQVIDAWMKASDVTKVNKKQKDGGRMKKKAA